MRRRALTTLSTSQNTDVKSEIREPQTLGWRRQEANVEFLAQMEEKLEENRVKESEFIDELYPHFRLKEGKIFQMTLFMKGNVFAELSLELRGLKLEISEADNSKTANKNNICP